MPSGARGRTHPPGPGDGPADRVLAARVQRGDRAAFERLVRRYLRPVHGVAASFLAEEADVEDAAQETFLRALDRIDTYDAGRPFAPWLYQIARNVARNRLDGRSRWRTEPLPDGGLEAGAGDPEDEMERADVRRRVDAAVAGLPERQRTVFRLLDVEGFSAAEAADMLGLTSGTVRSHLSHARTALREELAPWLDRREAT